MSRSAQISATVSLSLDRSKRTALAFAVMVAMPPCEVGRFRWRQTPGPPAFLGESGRPAGAAGGRWWGERLGQAVGEGAGDDAVGVGRAEAAGGARAGEPGGYFGLGKAGPGKEAASLVGERGESAFAPVVHDRQACGAAVDDGAEVGRAALAGPGGGPGYCGCGPTGWLACYAGDFAGEPDGHVAGPGGVAGQDAVGACGGGGAGGEAVGPAGFEVDLPGQAVAPGGVGEDLVEAVGGGAVPEVPPAGGGGDGDRLVAGVGGPRPGDAADGGQQAQAVAAIPVAGWVGPVLAGDGLGGQVDAGQYPGGQIWGWVAAVGVDVDQHEPGGPGGDAGDGGRFVTPPRGEAGGIGGGGADAVAPPPGGQARAVLDRLWRPGGGVAAGGAVAERSFGGGQGEDVPAERGQVQRDGQAGRVAGGQLGLVAAGARDPAGVGGRAQGMLVLAVEDRSQRVAAAPAGRLGHDGTPGGERGMPLRPAAHEGAGGQRHPPARGGLADGGLEARLLARVGGQPGNPPDPPSPPGGVVG